MELILEEDGRPRRSTVDTEDERSDDVVGRKDDDVFWEGELGEVKTSAVGGVLGDETGESDDVSNGDLGANRVRVNLRGRAGRRSQAQMR